MQINRLCALIRQRVSVQLLESIDPEERAEILVAALYELSRSVFPLLGPPRRSREYLIGQGAVSELISFLAIALIRAQARRGVAVLSEVAEGCLDPQLRRKLTVYAHELLAKSQRGQAPSRSPVAGYRWAWWLLPMVAAALVLYFGSAQPLADRDPGLQDGGEVAVQEAESAAAAPSRGPAPPPAAGRGAGDGALGQERAEQPPRQAERAAAEPVASGAPVEQATRVRVVNNQVLVPVLVKNGGEAVPLELVLDTGASRTVIHDTLASRLQIDLRQAKSSLFEVADGRAIRLHLAKVESLAVGPFALAPAELELIAYNGNEGAGDGLLGMDFLGKHRYQIDMEHEVIRWY